jgi:cob(I)alamin adenosyltransferase
MSTRIYTRTGDAGQTGLFGGQRVGKDDMRVEAYGTVDELNATLGVARTQAADPELDAVLGTLQHDLFGLGADLATPQEEAAHHGRITIARLPAERVLRLEDLIDRYEAELPPLRQFILPGGQPLAAALHFSRAVCRRAERCTVALIHTLEADQAPGLNPEVLHYLNRLSDLLFVLARVANLRGNMSDVLWSRE